MVNSEVEFSQKILIISFIDKMYWANIVYIFVPVIIFTLHYRVWMIIYIVLSLKVDPVPIIATSHII